MKRKQETCIGEETVKRPSAAAVPPDQYLVQPQQLTAVQLLTTASPGPLVGVPSVVSTVGALTLPPAVAVTVQTEPGAVAADPCILGGTLSCTQPVPHSSACSFVLTSAQPFVTSTTPICDSTSSSNTISSNLIPAGAVLAPADNTIISFTSNTPDSTLEPYNNSSISDISGSGFSPAAVSADSSYSSAFVSSSPSTVSTSSASPPTGRKTYAYKKIDESPAERQQRLSERFNALIRAKIIELVTARGIKKTVCPSEVARALSPRAWRDLMPTVRKIGAQLVKEGLILVTQRGTIVDLSTVRGPVRFGLAK